MSEQMPSVSAPMTRLADEAVHGYRHDRQMQRLHEERDIPEQTVAGKVEMMSIMYRARTGRTAR